MSRPVTVRAKQSWHLLTTWPCASFDHLPMCIFWPLGHIHLDHVSMSIFWPLAHVHLLTTRPYASLTNWPYTSWPRVHEHLLTTCPCASFDHLPMCNSTPCPYFSLACNRTFALGQTSISVVLQPTVSLFAAKPNEIKEAVHVNSVECIPVTSCWMYSKATGRASPCS